MNTPWKLIFQYKLSSRANAQEIYNQIFEAALKYKFRGVRKFAVPVNSVTLTEAIFDLKSTDKLRIANKVINGQKIKELFITTIFLKRLETKRQKGDEFFIVIPESETSCDTAIMIAGSESKPISETKLKLSQDHDAYLFQIKEYFDFERSREEGLLTIKDLDKEKISKLVGKWKYTENVLVFMRELLSYQSEDIKEFFDKNQNCLLISVPQDITVDGKNIELDPDKHNFIITFSDQTFSLESFERPNFLLDTAQIQQKLGLPSQTRWFP